VNYRVALLKKIILIAYLFRRFTRHWIIDHRDVYREYRKGVNLASFQRKFQQAQADAEVIHEVKIYVTALEALRHITGKLVNNESFLRFKVNVCLIFLIIFAVI